MAGNLTDEYSCTKADPATHIEGTIVESEKGPMMSISTSPSASLVSNDICSHNKQKLHQGTSYKKCTKSDKTCIESMESEIQREIKVNIAKYNRNIRERNRILKINNLLKQLRDKIPRPYRKYMSNKSGHLSKLKTLQAAACYIEDLQRMLLEE